MVLLTLLLKCCVMIQQERRMQDVYTFVGTDQCQLPEYSPYSYICKSTSRTICFEPIHIFSNNHDKFSQLKLLLSSDVELNPGPSDIDTVLSAIQASENKVLTEITSCCQILYLIYSASLIFYAEFSIVKKKTKKTEGEHTDIKSCCA